MPDAILPPNTADRVRRIFAVARESAAQFDHEQVLPEHLLLALVKEGGGVGANVLRNLDADLRKLRIELERRMPNGARTVSAVVPFSIEVRSVVERAKEEAGSLDHRYLGSEHILLALMQEPARNVSEVVGAFGLKYEEVKEEVENLLGVGVEPEAGKGTQCLSHGLPRPPTSVSILPPPSGASSARE
jgi:ATP-dependent Clp protease ATP-binding subunit ClpC